MKPVGGFSTWWAPLPTSVSSGHASLKYCLDVDAGQASGAHTYGWLARGGQHRGQREQQPVDVKWLNPPHCLNHLATSITDLRLRRAGFFFSNFNGLSMINGLPCHKIRTSDQPLGHAVVLDRAETVLVEHVKEHADAIKGVRNRPRRHGQGIPHEHMVKKSSSSKPAIQSQHDRARS